MRSEMSENNNNNNNNRLSFYPRASNTMKEMKVNQ